MCDGLKMAPQGHRVDRTSGEGHRVDRTSGEGHTVDRTSGEGHTVDRTSGEGLGSSFCVYKSSEVSELETLFFFKCVSLHLTKGNHYLLVLIP